MPLVKVIKIAMRAISANKLRTALAMLGIIIGVAAVIAMISLGEGAKKEVLESISKFGTNLLRVRPGAAQLGHIRTGSVETLTIADAEAVKEKVPGIRLLSPSVTNMAQVKYANKNATTLITGTTPEFIDINNFQVGSGRFFEPGEVKLMKRVVAIGATVKQKLFGEGPAVGNEIKIEGQNFMVIGVMEPKGQTSWYDPDDQVFIPVATSQKHLFNQTYVQDIYIQVPEVREMPAVKGAVEKLLRARHRIPDGTESDFSIRDYSEFLDAMKRTTRTFTILLAGIAAVSLLVGGIGVMNIMLVSVTERTREIGIRMAVGARRSDIMRQFLVEAVVITVTGGLTGIGAGYSISLFISYFGDWQTIVSLYSVLLGFIFSAAVGIIFGIYPARKASLMDPIEALRYE
ncbi:MAG: ABC transporter permease [Deltaproteobacteria bacterium]|nr:ABC transporter permease [Deltaproteobacteria bacterium]